MPEYQFIAAAVKVQPTVPLAEGNSQGVCYGVPGMGGDGVVHTVLYLIFS